MKEKLINYIHVVYNLKNKIAFFPSIIAITGCLFAYVMMVLEQNGISKTLLENFPELVINNVETARTILTTFIAGLISIMVFSFSMVMISLNQASSNYSPRLLPGLISNRKHQIILGIYIATILYCILILVFIEPEGKKYQLPGFSVLFAIIFMIGCLAAFIYFIHSISQAIQIENIMYKIFLGSERKISSIIDKQKKQNYKLPNTDKWFSYCCKGTGFYQNATSDVLLKIAKKNNFKIEITKQRTTYCKKGDILFKVDKELNDNTLKKVYNCFRFSLSELLDNDYMIAFKQLTEIGVKAMSPGINDPATAINAINYIARLFVILLDKDQKELFTEKDDLFIIIHTVPLDKIIYNTMVSFRTYSKKDVLLVQKLLSVLSFLKESSKNEKLNSKIDIEIENVLIDAKSEILNKRDLNLLTI